MEILTNLQKKILLRFSELSDKDVFYLTGGTALSAFYRVRTKMLNHAVKKNTKRFPEDFMFHMF